MHEEIENFLDFSISLLPCLLTSFILGRKSLSEKQKSYEEKKEGMFPKIRLMKCLFRRNESLMLHVNFDLCDEN